MVARQFFIMCWPVHLEQFLIFRGKFGHMQSTADFLHYEVGCIGANFAPKAKCNQPTRALHRFDERFGTVSTTRLFENKIVLRRLGR
mmetsp:Transcript_17738/g.45865  ORF Transcript_17738/g.45865 Transcript_17738/m.45865 type:complete len:87 (+) Transcript_17738:967-1227(+)